MAKDNSDMPDLNAQRDSKIAVRLWKQYFALDSQGRPNFSGSQFERFRGGGNKATRDVFTSDDLVAVSLLSVNVPAQSALRLHLPDGVPESDHWTKMLEVGVVIEHFKGDYMQ